MPLSDVLFQDAAQQRLQRALNTDRVPHAYLFTGPTGVGKEMLASRLAAVLLCESPRVVEAPHSIASGPGEEEVQANWLDACGECVECGLFAAGNHPDFHRIHRTLNKHHPDRTVQRRKAIQLGVDVVRHFLIQKIGLMPSRGRAKVFVVSEAERMSPGAQNALLKTLEEPPDHSFLILLGSAEDALLPTTRSRCQHVVFRRLPVEFIVEQLTSMHGASAESAMFLAELAQGSLGMSLRLAEANIYDRSEEVLQVLRGASGDPLQSGKALLEMAQGFASLFKDQNDEEAVDTNAARAGQTMVLAVVSTILRDIHRAAVGLAPVALPYEASIPELAEQTTVEAVRKAVQAVGRAEFEISRSGNTTLIFDSVGIELGRGLSGGGMGGR